MARIRTVKPSWLTDQRLALSSSAARVLSVALILLADDEGRGEAHPAILGGLVFAGEERPTQAAREALDELERIGFVRRYETGGQAFFWLPGFRRHQRIDRPSPSLLPVPPGAEADEIPPTSRSPESSTSPRRMIVEPSTNDRRALEEPSTSPQADETDPELEEPAEDGEPLTERSQSPGGSGHSTSPRRVLDEPSTSPRGSIHVGGGGEGKGKEGKGRERRRRGEGVPLPP